MKKFKNNKGLTGIDVVVSITIIVIVLGIVAAVYGTYSKKAKEVKRTTTATNLAMTVIEYIEGLDINDSIITSMPTTETEISTGYGVSGEYPNGYTVKIKKGILPDSVANADLINSLAFQVDVTVTYDVEDKEKSITLSAIKKKSEIEEAEKPNIKGDKIYNNDEVDAEAENVIPVKYDIGKDGYVRTNQYDSEWYSISSKVFPIVIKLNAGEDFNRNGIIKLNQCDSIYVWIPSYGTKGSGDSSIYRFCNKEGKIIEYVKESTNNIAIYTLSDESIDSDVCGGCWQKINADEKPVDNNGDPITLDDNPYNTIKNKIFTW